MAPPQRCQKEREREKEKHDLQVDETPFPPRNPSHTGKAKPHTGKARTGDRPMAFAIPHACGKYAYRPLQHISNGNGIQPILPHQPADVGCPHVSGTECPYIHSF